MEGGRKGGREGGREGTYPVEHNPCPKASRALRSMEMSSFSREGQQPEERVEARRGTVLPAERLCKESEGGGEGGRGGKGKISVSKQERGGY